MSTETSEGLLVLIALVGAVVNYLQQRQQNQLFRVQNQIFADQGGKIMPPEKPRFIWLKRYWPTLITVLLFLLIAYDIYTRHVPSVISWWFYALALLVVAVVGLVVGRIAGMPIATPIAKEPSKSTSANAWREGFSAPRFEIVDDHKFENEEIVVDNKSFRRCSFKNVKLLFHGNAPFEFVEGTTIDSGSVIFATDDPAILTFNVIQRKFASIPGAEIQHGALNSKGKDVPISPVTVESVATPSKPSQYPIPDLRLRVLAMCSELQGFMATHAHEPEKPERELPETNEQFLPRYRQHQQDKIRWGTRFAGDFRLQLLDRVSHLRDEMLAKAHINDFDLTAAIETAANDHTGNADAVERIIARFWTRACEINV
jgi:hypothetical protein